MISPYTEKDVRELLDGGIQALEEGETSRARALLSQVLQLDAQHEWAWYYLSWTMRTAPGSAWCLERVLDINPRQPHAKQRLRELGTQVDALTLQQAVHQADAGPSGELGALSSVRLVDGPRTMRTSLTPELAELAAWLMKTEQLLDTQETQLRALESRAAERDVELEDLQREAEALGEEMSRAEAAASRLQAEAEAVIEAHRRLAGGLDGLRRAARLAADDLGAVERELLETRSRVEQVERADDDRDLRLRALETRADARDAELEQVKSGAELLEQRVEGAEAATARLQADNEALTAAHRELAGGIDGWRRAARHTAEDLETVEQRLLETEGRVEKGREADEAARLQIGSLEVRADEHDAELDEVRRDADTLGRQIQSAETFATQLQAETQSVVDAQAGLARELDTLLVELLRTGQQLETMERRLSESEDRIGQGEGAAQALEDRVGSLEKELAVVPPAFKGVDKQLGALDRRATRAEKSIGGLRKQVSHLQREQRRLLQGKPRWAVVPILALLLGVILLSVGAMEVYPYMASRLRLDALLGGASAGTDADSSRAAPAGNPASETVEPSPSATGAPASSQSAPGMRPLAALNARATLTPTRVAAALPLGPPTPGGATQAENDVISLASARAWLSETPARAEPVSTAPIPLSTPLPPPTRTPVPPPPSPTPTPAVPTQLVVPAVDIDASVVPVSWQPGYEAVGVDGSWEVPDGGAVGWHDDSAPLGVPGNTVLNGHNTTNGEVFRYLYQVQAGDVIILYAGGVSFTYLVSQVLILPELGQPREVREANASYLLSTRDERLTLVTCHPYGSLRNRLIVIAYPA